jgi:hypothetical protein
MRKEGSVRLKQTDNRRQRGSRQNIPYELSARKPFSVCVRRRGWNLVSGVGLEKASDWDHMQGMVSEQGIHDRLFQTGNQVAAV